MANSRFPELSSSSGVRPSCHGEKWDGNVGSRSLIRLPKKAQLLPQRVAGHNIPTKVFASSSSGSGESESSPHGHGIRAQATTSQCCGRRDVGMASLAFLLFSLTSSNKNDDDDAALAGGMDKYLKRKKLDPLDTYVPTVLLAQSQIQEVDGKLEAGEQKTYADARSLLRTGPAASLRTDIRAVAQYAAETGSDDGPAASAAVDQCLGALEDLDSLLFQASRSQGAPVERMRKDLTMTVSALDKLLATVPAPILEKSRAIAEAYKEANY